MDGMGFRRTYHEQVEELKQKMLCTKFEIDTMLHATEEVNKQEEQLKQLNHLYDINQVENLLFTKYTSSHLNQTIYPFNYDPFFNVVAPPAPAPAPAPGYSKIDAYANKVISMTQQVDNKNMNISRIDLLVQGRPLPKRGQLLKAVMDAGPTLQNLVVAGPKVPIWRNPPKIDTMLVPSSMNLDTIGSRLKKPRVLGEMYASQSSASNC